ncbi:lipopolysaccharide biosynthesis protein [Escherichia albertii]|uniref:Putative O-antigen transporter n=1 Tax=Escherichia albertii TaxID=208962 RepID=A0A5A4U4C5_ESCAL|nr:oligosaccharide flippase family protein [Escherichia albertii]MCZ9168626.1 oligosaccharide flippase family protein [Escherichia albertii]BBM62837.1 O-antigen flippase [Escherichia albertii]
MSLFKISSIYLFSNILNALIPFLLLPILTHNLTPNEYGQVAMFQTLISGVAALTGLNTVGAANRKYYDDMTQSELSIYNGGCIQILFASTFFLLIIVYSLREQLSEWLNIPTGWVFLAVGVSAGNFIVQFRLGQWQIREKVCNFGALQVTQSLLSFSLTLIFLLVLKYGVVSRVNALVFATSIYVVISLITLSKDNLLELFSVRFDYITDALKFGIPLVPHIIGIFFLSAIDRILINGQLGVSEAGIYMLAVQLSLGMVVFFDAINKALIPWLFRVLSENDKRKIHRLVKYTYCYFALLIFLGGLSFWIGPLIVELVAGKNYLRATSVIGWLCLGQAFNGMYLMVTNYIFYAKNTVHLSVVTILCGVLNIILLVVMMKINGIVGVAMAFSFSMCIRFLATWWLAFRLNLIQWNIFTKYK